MPGNTNFGNSKPNSGNNANGERRSLNNGGRSLEHSAVHKPVPGKGGGGKKSK